MLFGRNVVDDEQVAALSAALRAERDGVVIGDRRGGRRRHPAGRGRRLDPARQPRARRGRRRGPDRARSPRRWARGWPRAASRWTSRRPRTCRCTWTTRSSASGRSAAIRHLAARHVAAFVQGCSRSGVAACAKHFPGHGGVAEDSHHSLPVLRRGRTGTARRRAGPVRGGGRGGRPVGDDGAPGDPGVGRGPGDPEPSARTRCCARSWASPARSSPTRWTWAR